MLVWKKGSLPRSSSSQHHEQLLFSKVQSSRHEVPCWAPRGANRTPSIPGDASNEQLNSHDPYWVTN